MEITINIGNLLFLWFTPGLIWSLFFTGIWAAKGIKGHVTGELKWDNVTTGLLIIMFFTSLIAWPWSIYNNLPYAYEVIRRIRRRSL